MDIQLSSEEQEPGTLPGEWATALTLSERLTCSQPASVSSQSLSPERLAHATQRLQRWQRQGAFNDEDIFQKRLSADHCTKDELLLLLAETPTQLSERCLQTNAQPWMQKLNEVFEEHDPARCRLCHQIASNALKEIQVLDVIHPFLDWALAQIMDGLQDLAAHFQSLPFHPARMLKLLIPNIPGALVQTLMKPLILEVHIARLENRLQGETSQARFQEFLHFCSQQEHLQTFLQEYTVLARYLVTVVDFWAQYCLELLTHLCQDWSEILATFTDGRDPGQLVRITMGRGDTHKNGRSVAILHFNNDLTLVYKPRSLATDLHFQQLLAWVNSLGIPCPFRLLQVLNKDNHGWCEFVTAASCTTREEVVRFYERQGAYLALLYALDAADMHSENILAAGEHPVLLDLEALFHPRFDHIAANGAALSSTIKYSVLRTGMLPVRVQRDKDGRGIDLSALGRQRGQHSSGQNWKGQGTDEMTLEREYRELSASSNRPTLQGQDVDVCEFIPDILRGFTHLYRLLMQQRETLLADWLPRFMEDEIRVVFRPTSVYHTYLQESLHPDCLRDALERDQFLDHLWDFTPLLSHPQYAALLTAERLDLLQGDIPLFTTRPSSRDVYTSRGERLPEYFSAPPIDGARECIQGMHEDDLARQQWIIEASLTTMFMDTNQQRKLPLSTSSRTVTAQELVTEACAIGDRLRALALDGEQGSKQWLGVVLEREEQDQYAWNLQPADYILYDGLAGIILFLAYLGAATRIETYTELARAALPTLWRMVNLQRARSARLPLGAFNGQASLLYLFSHLAALWKDDRYLQQAEELLPLLEQSVEQEQTLDIIGGSAGIIASLLSLYSVNRSQKTLATALLYGDHLLQHARSMQTGVGWSTTADQRCLTGFSHGASGISYSLIKLAEISNEQRFLQAARDGFRYERTCFVEEVHNWVNDSGAAGRKPVVQSTWCHGAPGIGLGRLAVYNAIEDPVTKDEVDIALKTTLDAGFSGNHSLCHGALGNLETVLLATQVLGDSYYKEQLTCIQSMVFEGIKRYGWITGVPLGVETPGLMTGLAGIGYQLLRLAYPECIPSVLLLAPPLPL